MHTLSDQFEAIISYAALPGEPDPGPFLAVPAAYTIAPDARLDPFHEAARALEQAQDRRTALLMPGTGFDATGTRHGRGGGWYDRFVAEVPAEWVRIGFCFREQFSAVPLKREAWDQPVDYVCVVDRATGASEWIETGARFATLTTMEKKPLVSTVVAIGKDRVIGRDNQLLWHIPDDLKRFKAITLGHPVIMGRKTFESIVSTLGKALPGRTNIVITRDMSWSFPDVIVAHSLDEAMTKARELDQEEVFIGGGGQIYAEALPLIDRLYLTVIEDDRDGDSFFPAYEQEFTKVLSEERREHDGLAYSWIDLERP